MKFNFNNSKVFIIVTVFSSLCIGYPVNISLTNDNQITLLASLTSGACQTVKIKNDTILIGMGNSIVVLTLENDNSINEVAKINIQGEVQDLYIEDNHVFVLSQCTSPDGYYYNLSVVQLSPISSVIGSIVINAKNIEAFTYFNNYILVFSGDLNELIFINTNNFSQPFIEQSYDYIYRRENGWPEVVWRFATKDS
ncbi:MAG: hypothetical protein PHC43_06570, partial [Candidatus Marinimicrobia bacterium]|nr:hypothetical protein [Candidatus Neomarinimicrobiota bacterium]